MKVILDADEQGSVVDVHNSCTLILPWTGTRELHVTINDEGVVLDVIDAGEVVHSVAPMYGDLLGPDSP